MKPPVFPCIAYIAALCCLLFCCPVAAEQMYVSDTIKITVRNGPGTGHKILRMVTTGDSVTRIRSEKDWSLVKVDENTQGWILNRFLSTEIPIGIRLQRLKKKYAALEKFASDPLEENVRLKEENHRLATQLASVEADLERLRQDHNALRTESADYLNLKAAHKRAIERLSTQTTTFEKMEAELSALQKQQIFRWFLSGAGVLLLGFIIGLGARKNRRRYSF